jgi:hypothetical protein
VKCKTCIIKRLWKKKQKLLPKNQLRQLQRPKQLRTSEAKWLVEKVEHFFKDVENSPELIEKEIDQLYVLIGALKVLGLDGASQAFIPRLSDIKKRKDGNEYVV